MKQLEFRGLDIETKELIYGTSLISRRDWDEELGWSQRYFLLNGDSCNQLPKIEDFHEIDHESLQRSTQLTDKSGKEIYEGDILWKEKGEDAKPYLYFVRWDEGRARFNFPRNGHSMPHADVYEIIGNVWENPELLETH